MDYANMQLDHDREIGRRVRTLLDKLAMGGLDSDATREEVIVWIATGLTVPQQRNTAVVRPAPRERSFCVSVRGMLLRKSDSPRAAFRRFRTPEAAIKAGVAYANSQGWIAIDCNGNRI